MECKPKFKWHKNLFRAGQLRIIRTAILVSKRLPKWQLAFEPIESMRPPRSVSLLRMRSEAKRRVPSRITSNCLPRLSVIAKCLGITITEGHTQIAEPTFEAQSERLA